MRSTFFIVIFFLTSLVSIAQVTVSESNEWRDPSIASVGREEPRSGFISYDIREHAESMVRDSSPFYMPLKMESPANLRANTTFYITQTLIPYMWLDRDLFIHIEGAPAFYLYVNDKKVGYGTDSRAASEFNISKFVADGVNTIRIESLTGSKVVKLETITEKSDGRAPLGMVYLYSQPKLRVQDYAITAQPDSLGKSGLLKIDVALSNSYNSTETITVGYDIYSPAGKLQYYDMKEAKLSGRSIDTVRFKDLIPGVMQNLWSASTPNLYRLIIYIKRSGRMTEYIPFRVGFGRTELTDGVIVRNGKPLEIKAASYNAATSAAQTKTDITKLKAAGINTISLDYPQADWFYELCDAVGMYVIDQANINNSDKREDLAVGGTTSNDPQWLNSYLDRVEAMYARNRNHPCVIAWSLGGDSGNGYNMYRSYQWLKGADSHRAVIYRDADGEWNSDIDYPQVVDGEQVLSKIATSVKSTTRGR